MKTKVAVFFGGKSAEYSVSLNSAYALLESIDRNKYDVLTIGISENGNFYYYDGHIDNIKNDTWLSKSKFLTLDLSSNNKACFYIEDETLEFDIAFPMLHGTNGEDGRLQGLFELLGIKYVGCDMSSSSLAMDKYNSKLLVEQSGIKISKSLLIFKHDSFNTVLSKLENFKLPLYIKPLKAGSSYGITKLESLDSLEKALEYAFEYDHKVIIEENITGFEVGCAIMGNNNLIIGNVDEIELSHGFFNFEEKYTLKTSQIHLPARISEELSNNVKEIALSIYKTLGCKGCARVDLFIDDNQNIVFNEVNTMPGFTLNSRFPNMLKSIGYSFTDIISELIELGLENE